MNVSVWNLFGMKRQYYLRHPLKWVRDLFRSIKWAWQRSVRGYADCDWWNFDEWMIAVLAPMFDDYAEHHYGYPGEAAGWSDEKWTAYLREIAQHLRNCSEDQTTNPNEYEEDWLAVLSEKWGTQDIFEDEDGFIHHVYHEPSAKQIELEENYRRRAEEVYNWRCNEAVTAFSMIGKEFFSLWD